MRIAKSAGAEENATSSYENAVAQMKQADGLATMKHVDKKALISASREVVQTADDAREIAVKRIDADRVDAEKNAAANQVADADAATADAKIDAWKPIRRERWHSNRSEMPRPNRTGIARLLLTPIKQQRMPRPNQTGIVPLRLMPIKPRQMPSKGKETRRRNQSEIKPRPQTRISNSSKPCSIVKNFAPSCCSNSTPSLLLAIPLAVSS